MEHASDARSGTAMGTAPFVPAVHRIRTVEAMDADEHAHNLTDWEQSYDQISPGHFHGTLEELQLPQMQVFRERTSQAVRQSCCVWPDALWFGLADHAGITRINGRIAGTDAIMLRPGHREFELMTPADYTIYGIVIRQRALESAAERIGCQLDWAQLAGAEVMHVSEASRRACVRTLAGMLAAGSDAGAAQSLPQAAITSVLLAMLDTRDIDKSVTSSFVRRQHIVAQAREFVLAHHDRAISVPELCERLYVSRRTLQYCFEDVLGISPIQYLRIIRLNGARRHLREDVSGTRTVRDVAEEWGFWHFSQFSSDYRKLFGERPRESLAACRT